jgi:hypothetical protein
LEIPALQQLASGVAQVATAWWKDEGLREMVQPFLVRVEVLLELAQEGPLSVLVQHD